MVKDYSGNVFVNCPFDEEYLPILNAIIFAIFDCGFIPRSALEEDDGGITRFDKIKHLISISKFGIHDISRTELDEGTDLPRFNMPLELGVFVGAKRFGNTHQAKKNTLILDKEQYRYQMFMSDIAGQDIRSHENEPAQVISIIRNWLNSASDGITIQGGAAINERYERFLVALPEICGEVQLVVEEVTYVDYCNLASGWLRTRANVSL